MASSHPLCRNDGCAKLYGSSANLTGGQQESDHTQDGDPGSGAQDPQVDVLGDVVGEEVGEDVALGDAQPGLRLTAERTLVHSLPPVVYDVVVEQAK